MSAGKRYPFPSAGNGGRASEDIFVTFPYFIRLQLSFYTALIAALFAMVVTYFITIAVLDKFDIRL